MIFLLLYRIPKKAQDLSATCIRKDLRNNIRTDTRKHLRKHLRHWENARRPLERVGTQRLRTTRMLFRKCLRIVGIMMLKIRMT